MRTLFGHNLLVLIHAQSEERDPTYYRLLKKIILDTGVKFIIYYCCIEIELLLLANR